MPVFQNIAEFLQTLLLLTVLSQGYKIFLIPSFSHHPFDFVMTAKVVVFSLLSLLLVCCFRIDSSNLLSLYQSYWFVGIVCCLLIAGVRASACTSSCPKRKSLSDHEKGEIHSSITSKKVIQMSFFC